MDEEEEKRQDKLQQTKQTKENKDENTSSSTTNTNNNNNNNNNSSSQDIAVHEASIQKSNALIFCDKFGDAYYAPLNNLQKERHLLLGHYSTVIDMVRKVNTTEHRHRDERGYMNLPHLHVIYAVFGLSYIILLFLYLF